jgi:Domain of unknown function (DUF4899)
MVENLDNAVNSLSEQTKKINIALFFTGNDMDKAKQMVAGAYKDIFVLKMKFTSSSVYGAMITFLNTASFRLVDSFLVVSNDYLIANIDNNLDWKNFEKEITNARSNMQDFRLVTEIKDKIDRGFISPVCTNIIKLVEKGDHIQLSHALQKFVQECTGLQRVDISVEIQKISSLEMELESTSTRKIDTKAVEPQKKEEDEEIIVEKNPEDDDEIKPGKNGIRAVIRSSLILSPIKGKNINELKLGDRVLISLIDHNDTNKSIAKAFKAYDEAEGRILPIPARIKSLKYIDGTGYKIFVVIAKGVVGQIIEEEKNIKVALDPAVLIQEDTEKVQGSKAGLTVIVALFVVIIVLVAVILFMVL